MFVIVLRFGVAKGRAGEFMAGHNDWIAQGFAEGRFLMVGSLADGGGGVILARGEGVPEMVAQDPFVVEGIVVPEIMEIRPGRMDTGLAAVLA